MYSTIEKIIMGGIIGFVFAKVFMELNKQEKEIGTLKRQLKHLKEKIRD